MIFRFNKNNRGVVNSAPLLNRKGLVMDNKNCNECNNEVSRRDLMHLDILGEYIYSKNYCSQDCFNNRHNSEGNK